MRTSYLEAPEAASAVTVVRVSFLVRYPLQLVIAQVQAKQVPEKKKREKWRTLQVYEIRWKLRPSIQGRIFPLVRDNLCPLPHITP